MHCCTACWPGRWGSLISIVHQRINALTPPGTPPFLLCLHCTAERSCAEVLRASSRLCWLHAHPLIHAAVMKGYGSKAAVAEAKRVRHGGDTSAYTERREHRAHRARQHVEGAFGCYYVRENQTWVVLVLRRDFACVCA